MDADRDYYSELKSQLDGLGLLVDRWAALSAEIERDLLAADYLAGLHRWADDGGLLSDDEFDIYVDDFANR